MSTDTEVVVQIAETPVKVTLDTGTPVITLTNLEDPSDVTVVEGAPVTVAVANNQPVVNVTNGGGGTIIDQSKIMELLAGSLDVDIFAPELQDDIRLLKDLWLRTGRSIGDILLQFDVDTINQIAQAYTDTQIQTTALSIAEVDGKITAAESALTQTAAQINLRIGELETDTGESLSSQTSRLDIQAGQIQSSVSRIDNLLSADGTTGVVAETITNVSQQSDRITQEVIDRQTLANGVVTENTTRLTQTAEALVANVTKVDELSGRVNTAETRLTSTESITEILSAGLGNINYVVSAVESLSASRYGVVIEEDVNGVTHVAGFEMLIHPLWFASTVEVPFTYDIGDVVSYSDDKVYRCILAHTPTSLNSPGSIDGTTYWALLADSAKSAFNVEAQNFNILTPGGPTPVFTVDAETGKIRLSASVEFVLPEEYLLYWEGARVIPNNAYEEIAEEWIFTGSEAPGAMLVIETSGDFDGELEVSFNDIIMTTDLFGDQNFGSVSPQSTGFSDENVADNFIDLSVGDKSYDLGGF